MKERMLLILLVGVFMIGIVSAVNSCDDSQTIMRLYQASNSHVSFWNESVSNYTVEICYDEIFGETYTDANPHACTGANRILSLFDVSNSHAANVTDANYNNEVCYGDLICDYEADTAFSDTCVNGGKVVARMYSGFNSHVSNASDTNYFNRICCVKTVAVSTSALYWADTEGNLINTTANPDSTPNIGDTIQAVVTGASSGLFTIMEKDTFSIFPPDTGIDDTIRENVNGESDGKGNWIYKWKINDTDLRKADDNNEMPNSGLDRFYFKTDVTGDEESDTIAISGIYDDTPMNITVVEPNCGDYFSVGGVTIEIAASDDDDNITGQVSINEANVSNFTNGGVTFTHPFPSIGNYQIIADAINSRGKRSRHIANIIVLDDTDKKYVAACISEPKDFSDIDTASVTFNASTTVGIEVNSSGITTVRPGGSGNDRFKWYWSFSTGQSRNIDDPIGSEGYFFTVNYPTVGQNSASLRVEFI